jgi:hypothetical protein
MISIQAEYLSGICMLARLKKHYLSQVASECPLEKGHRGNESNKQIRIYSRYNIFH